MRYWWTFLAIMLFLLALHNTANAQKLDPRIATEAVASLQAEITLRDAVIRALREDAETREKAMSEWFKGWFGEPKPVPPKTK